MTLGFMDASVGPLRVCDGVLLAGARGCCVERSRRECDAACVPDRPCMAFQATNRNVVASDVKMVLRDVAWRSVPPLRRTLPCIYRESPSAITFAKNTSTAQCV